MKPVVSPRVVRVTALAVTVAGIVAAVATALAGLVLADGYHPGSPGSPAHVLGTPAAHSAEWVDRHQLASLALLALVVVVAALVVWVVVTGSGRPGAPILAAVLIAMAGALATMVTRGLVRFDQVALRQVTVGLDMAGYWSAAFDADVLFVLVDGVQVSPQAYAAAVLVHLVAPVVAAAALLVVAGELLRDGDLPPPEPAWSV